jgi:uncharacterized membrane protein (UPF0127 family)
VFPVLLLLFSNVSCEARGPEAVSFEKETLVIRTAGGDVAVNAEIARSDAQRERGYMYREKIGDGEGMLFIFDRDQVLSFWMKETRVPLSIAYIASDGRLLEIRDMKPFDLNPVVSARSARYALEVPAGWFARAGVKAGDILDTGNLKN